MIFNTERKSSCILLVLLLIVLSICSASTRADRALPGSAGPIDLFIIAGQSNAQGWAGDGARYPLDPEKTDDKIRFYWVTPGHSSSRGEWTSMQVQGGRFPKGHFGPEVMFARHLAERGYHPAIFKYTLGATSLANNWRRPGEGLYDGMVREYNKALGLLVEQGHTVNIQAFVWIQGESDATEQLAAGYNDRLQKLIDDLRTIVVKKPELPILLGVDEQHPGVQNYPIIVEQHQAIADSDPHVVFTSMKGLEKADSTHLTPAGLEKHGKRLFDSFIQMTRFNPYVLKWNMAGKNANDSMPIGNGDIGVNLWTEVNGNLVFYLSKTDTWSENCQLLKLGKVRVSLSPNPFAGNVPFSQELRLKNGEIFIEAGKDNQQVQLRIWVDTNNPVVNIDLESEKPINANVTFEPWRTTRRALETTKEIHSAYGLDGDGSKTVYVEPDTVVSDAGNCILWYHRNQRSIWKDNLTLQALGELANSCDDPLMNRTFGGLIESDGMVRKSDTQLVSGKASKSLQLSINILGEQTETTKEWLDNIQEQSREIRKLSYKARLESHRKWWQDFWQRSYIHISGDENADTVMRGYALQRWINACGGRGKSPIKFNGTIFTVDTFNRNDRFKDMDADYRQWGGPFWWQNTRLLYWSMLCAGDFDLMQPVFNMYRDALDVRKMATKKYYGHEGAFYPETMYFWGTYTDSNYGRDRSKLPDGLTLNLFIRYYWQNGLEMALIMLDYYAMTQDQQWARQIMLPVVTNVITFFDQHWGRDDQGKIFFEPAMALETYREATNPLVEIVGIAKVCNELLALPENLTTAAQRSQWKRLISELPPVPMTEVDGQKVLTPAEKYRTKQNSENPELYAIFPYRLYAIGKDDIDIARRSFARRANKQTGGWQQNAIKAAYLGLTDQAAKLVTTNFKTYDRHFRFPAFWGPNYDWTPDQDHGSVAMIALQRMLMQYDGDKVYVLPAWPEKWDAEFKLHAPKNTTVEGVVSGGKLKELKVRPQSRRNDIVIVGK